MRDLDDVFSRLEQSTFRQRFKLGAIEAQYLKSKGLEEVLRHARDFVEKRLAAANPSNDGRQTPMRGHPVFIAQHATATCCRAYLEKWHGIRAGCPLGAAEKERIVSAVARWLSKQSN